MATRDQNALGAPASGFGQNISYAREPNARGLPAMQGAGEQAPRGGVAGGNVGRVTQAPGVGNVPAEDPTTSLLFKMGEKILAPALKDAKRRKFLEGMTRAANGEAVKDIVDQQPAWAALFGDTDVVAGARAYESQAAVSRVVQSLEESMPDMRKLPPEAASGAYAERLKQGMTGDPEVDINVMASVSKMLPAVMKRHAKEHYSYLQEQASESESKARLADADAIMAAASGLQSGTVTQEEFDLRVAQLPARGRPALGRNMESYAKQLAADMGLMARKGQLHALNAYRKAGFMEALPADLAKQVEGAVDVAENQLAARYSGEWADEIAAIKLRAEQPNLPGNTPRSVIESIRGLNDQYRKATGSTRDIVPLNETVSTALGLGKAIYQAEKERLRDETKRLEDLAKAGEKDLLEAQKLSLVDRYLAAGDTVQAKLLPGVSDELIHTQFVKRYQQEAAAGKGGEFLALAYKQSRYINPVLQAQLTAGLRGNTMNGVTDGLMQSYQQWRGLRGMDDDGSLAAAYFAQDNMDAKMEAFHVLSNGGDPVAAGSAYQYAFVRPLAHKPDPMSAKERKALSKGLMSELSFTKPEWLGGEVDLRSDQLDFVTRATQRAAEVYMGAVPGITPERARKLALDQAQREGLQVMGGFVWMDGKNQTPVTTEVERRIGPDVPADPTSRGRMFREAIRAGLGKYADEPVALMRDPSGAAALMASVVVDGATKVVRIPFDDMAATARKWITEERKPRVPILGIKKESLQFGPDITYQPAPGAKSIYR